MNPSLHQWYAREEAIAAFGEAAPDFLCDEQFAILPKTVLCLITVGDEKTEPFLGTPTSVVWKPRRLNYTPTEEVTWLPVKVREVWDRSGPTIRQIRGHHVFLRLPADARFFYAGPAHLGSYGVNGRGKGSQSAGFTLAQKVPREVWLRFGGYPGWFIEVNHRTHLVDQGDNAVFQRLVKRLSRRKFSHLSMTRYEEDSFSIHANTQRGWLMYLRHPGDCGLYTRDVGYNGDPAAEELFACKCGIDLEFPANQTLPRELAFQALLEFFQTGVLPKCLPWQPQT
jgi:hypothetical protein